MKKIIYTFLFLINLSTFGQSENKEVCYEYKEKAISDAQKKLYISESYGLIKVKDHDLKKDYEIYLYSEYGIESADKGCVIIMDEYCYTKVMDSIILNHFGSDIYSKTKKIVESQFSKKSTEEKSKILNSSKYYQNHLESPPKFKGNDNTIREYLYSVSSLKNNCFYCPFEIQINKKGKITNIELNDFHILHKNIKLKDVIVKMNKLGKWTPGYIYGNKVNSTIQFN